jgi:hypothetical protein
MTRQDDPTLAGDIKVLRRIPPKADRVQWENDTPTPSSQNFRDNRDDEWSAYIARETTPEKILQPAPEQILRGEDCKGYGIVEITLGEIRAVYAQHNKELVICRDDANDPGHILVCGKPSPRMREELKQRAKWLPGYLPAKLPLT